MPDPARRQTPKRNNWKQWGADRIRDEARDRLVERFLPEEHQQWIYFNPEGEDDVDTT